MMSKFVVAASLAGVAAANTGANPIRRVVTLLQDMQKEIEAEGEKEEDLYKKFSCYCSGNTEGLSAEADAAASAIETLKAQVKSETAMKAQLTEELKEHKKDRSEAKTAVAEATKIREKENATYIKDSGETKQNIDSLNSAVTALEKGMGGSFLQTTNARVLKTVVSSIEGVDASDREIVMNFLQATGDYIPASGEIVGILKNMKDVMDKSLGGIVGDEENAAASYKALMAAKSKEIAAATAAIEKKTVRAGELAVSIVQAKNSQSDATEELDDTQKFLAELKVTCKEKASEWDDRVKARNEEVMAIGQAISVLNDDDALDVFKDSLGKKGSFLQTGVVINKASKALNMIKKVKADSPALTLLSNSVVSKLKSGKVDFSKVMKMIDDMVSLLKTEQVDDEKHKSMCESELDSNADEKKDTEGALADIAAAIAEVKDRVAMLSEEIATHQSEIKALDKSVAEATETRKEEHTEFEAKIALNGDAMSLLEKAKNKLNKFYNPNLYKAPTTKAPTEEERIFAGAMSFLQLKNKVSQPEKAPETWDGKLQAKTGKSNSVIALMDMLLKDLTKDTQAAEHDEKTSQRDYEELMADSATSRAAGTKAITDKSANKADAEMALQGHIEDKTIKEDQLATVKTTIADLHTSCDFLLGNFEVRKEARTGEIDSLNNAKAVLSGADFA